MTEWISCEDTLPPIHKEVLIWEKWCDVPCVAYLTKQRTWYPVKDFIRADSHIENLITQADVTHWMSLPEPPKEDK